MFSTSDMFTLDFLLMTFPLNSSTVLSSSLRSTKALRYNIRDEIETTTSVNVERKKKKFPGQKPININWRQ